MDSTFSFVDLFAGIGGFRCGLTAAGGSCLFSSDWDQFSQKTYSAWYGSDNLYCGDICAIPINEIPSHDILAAGFPCQPFSLAGVSKKTSLGKPHGFHDPDQGNLFFQICRIVGKLRPKIIILENVKNLLSHDQGRTWLVIQKELETLDYEVFHKVINAAHWVPQHRERVFIVAFAREQLRPTSIANFSWPPLPTYGTSKISDILEDNPDKKYMLGDKTWACLQSHAQAHKKKGNGFGYGVCEPTAISRTLSARYHKDGAEILIRQKGWRNPRKLTPTEALHLMGFCTNYARMFGHHDGFQICVSDTQAYRQLGNSVVPQVVEYVANAATEYWNKNRTNTFL